MGPPCSFWCTPSGTLVGRLEQQSWQHIFQPTLCGTAPRLPSAAHLVQGSGLRLATHSNCTRKDATDCFSFSPSRASCRSGLDRHAARSTRHAPLQQTLSSITALGAPRVPRGRGRHKEARLRGWRGRGGWSRQRQPGTPGRWWLTSNACKSEGTEGRCFLCLHSVVPGGLNFGGPPLGWPAGRPGARQAADRADRERSKGGQRGANGSQMAVTGPSKGGQWGAVRGRGRIAPPPLAPASRS
jgi:hypothetical protein